MTTQPSTSSPVPRTRKSFAGVFVRRECWTLTWRARVAVLVAIVSVCYFSFLQLYSFLAPDRRTHGDLLLVEGWIPQYALKETVDLYRANGYRRILTTGGAVINDRGEMATETTAEWAAAELRQLGMSSETVTAIPCPGNRRDRTYSAALETKRWLTSHGIPLSAVDVVTIGPHARRSRLLCQMAFGDSVAVGVIPIDDRTYEPAHWWRTSQGVHEVMDEAMAYVYVRLLFHPKSSESEPLASR